VQECPANHGVYDGKTKRTRKREAGKRTGGGVGVHKNPAGEMWSSKKPGNFDKNGSSNMSTGIITIKGEKG